MTKNNNMGNKISKTLDAVFARVTFDLTKADIRQSYKDRIALEILREDGTMAYRALVSKLKDWELFQAPLRIENLIKTQPRDEEVAPEEFLKQYRRKLLDENKTVRNVSTAHALLDIAADTTTATSQILAQYGITAQTIASAMTELTDPLPDLQSEIRFHAVDLNDESGGKSSAMLDKFGSDLTRLAREGKIDPVIGREAEIDRVIQILSRRKKNNPILIGEAGVGKSAIIEGLALRIASGEVPYTIRNKTIFSLDVASLVAGTKFRGEFEERMQQLLDELRRSKDTIIFIDEIHTIVGAGATQGSLDTANILKPALARGELQTIGATTLDEFRENIESDSALERRFQKVMIDPTSAAQTLEILRNIAPYYEKHHNVRYSEDALKACVALTERYITDRHFPDKAIDVMDEAGARTRIGAAQEPDSIRETERQLQAVELERREAVTALIYEKAATARIKEVALKSRLNEQRAEWHRDMQSNPIEIGTAEVERVITSMTGIPAEHISHGEAERLRSLGEYLEGRVIGQSEAVQRVSRALQRSRAGLKDAGRPIGVFLFVGPTGVGKTLLAKELSKWLFDSKRGLIRIDMSEYGEKHNGIRGLRRRRTAHRGGATPALCRDSVRRDREGASRRVQLDVADLRRGTPHRRFGPQGRLPQHGDNPHLERGIARRGREERAGGLQHPVERYQLRGDAVRRVPQGSGVHLRARVPQPHRRHRILPHADGGRRGADHRSGVGRNTLAHQTVRLRGGDHLRSQATARRDGLRVALRSPRAAPHAARSGGGAFVGPHHRRQVAGGRPSDHRPRRGGEHNLASGLKRLKKHPA